MRNTCYDDNCKYLLGNKFVIQTYEKSLEELCIRPNVGPTLLS